MISRIIEARPEELRVFLEEAAGVSKYKERRRETEHRLADTRDNLARLGDIRQELESQIERLGQQAETARRYSELSAERAQKQNLLWLVRRNEALAEAQRHTREVERAAVELEAETARLRESERELERARTEHYSAGDALSAAQGELYGANADVSRIETEMRFVADTRQRLEAQLAQMSAQRDAGRRNEIEQREALRGWDTLLAESRQEALLGQLEAARAAVDERRRTGGDGLQTLEREIAALEGKLATLEKIQCQVEENSKVQDWIAHHQLASKPRLWQKIRVEQGWETAVESVLRERLHAMEMSDPELLQRLLDDPPPARVSAFSPGADADLRHEKGLTPLAEYVESGERAVGAVVSAWLAPYYAVEGVPRLLTRMALPPHVVLVNREGHQFSRFGVSFHAPDPADTGILARQREIEGLKREAGDREEQIEKKRQELAELERSLAEHDEGLVKLRAAGAALKQRHHERELEHLRLTQSQERYEERSSQIDGELAEIAAQQAQERSAQSGAEASLERHQAEIDELYRRFDASEKEQQDAERALEEQRQRVQQTEREAQEAGFMEKECISKINDINISSNTLLEHVAQADQNLEKLQAELASVDDRSEEHTSELQ